MNPTTLSMFSKHLQGVPIDQAAAWVREIGITSLDVTVRKGGHVDPARVADDLPRFADTIAKLGLSVGMITTEILNAREPTAEPILKAAASLGVKYYKLGYYRYSGFGTLATQRDAIAAKFRELAQLNASLGICGGYHNHSDDFFGADLADVMAVLEGVDPSALGVYFDPAHATIEGGSRGWLMALDRVAPRLVMLAVKDYRWVEGKHRAGGGRRHSQEWCPLAEGNTQWPQIVGVLKRIGFSGPVSFHSEYQGKNSFRDLTVHQVVEQTGADLALFRSWLESVG